jgi:N-carbamoyl-D-amino-acid hydrolase
MTSRAITVAAAQLGPIQQAEPRSVAVERMIRLMEHAHKRGVELVVFPELALTTFFPRHYHADIAEADHWFESAMPSNETAPLFAAARKYGIGFHLGYAEHAMEQDETGRVRKRRFNSSILVNPDGEIMLKYRKVHLPGHAEYDPRRTVQHLEKRYFEVGNLGFPVWRTMGGVMGMCLCNDRRWPETFRVMGLQGVELVMLGYNTPVGNAVGQESPELRMFHNHLTMQAGAYQNGTFVIGSAKAGLEEGVDMQGGSCVVAPSGEILALAETVGDELVVARIDLDDTRFNKTTIFNFAAHRRIEHYGLITGRTEAVPPPEQ